MSLWETHSVPLGSCAVTFLELQRNALKKTATTLKTSLNYLSFTVLGGNIFFSPVKKNRPENAVKNAAQTRRNRTAVGGNSTQVNDLIHDFKCPADFFSQSEFDSFFLPGASYFEH